MTAKTNAAYGRENADLRRQLEEKDRDIKNLREAVNLGEETSSQLNADLKAARESIDYLKGEVAEARENAARAQGYIDRVREGEKPQEHHELRRTKVVSADDDAFAAEYTPSRYPRVDGRSMAERLADSMQGRSSHKPWFAR